MWLSLTALFDTGHSLKQLRYHDIQPYKEYSAKGLSTKSFNVMVSAGARKGPINTNPKDV
jgi:hypothetical protein